jgi:hypothetical protein
MLSARTNALIPPVHAIDASVEADDLRVEGLFGEQTVSLVQIRTELQRIGTFRMAGSG